MANEKQPTPGTRGWRVDQIRQALDISRDQFAEELARLAAKLKLDGGGKWTATRVSKTILSRQPIPLDDAAVIIALAAEKGLKGFGWDWFVFGEQQIPKRRSEPHERRVG